jgi:hypothetical protein
MRLHAACFRLRWTRNRERFTPDVSTCATIFDLQKLEDWWKHDRESRDSVKYRQKSVDWCRRFTATIDILPLETIMLYKYKIWRFQYKNPVCTSQKTHYFSATKLSLLMLCKILGVHGDDYEECRLLGYKTQYVLYRRHSTSPLQSSAG